MVSGFISVPKPALWEDGGFPPHNQEDVNDRTSFYPQWLTLEYLSPDANQVLLTHFFHPHSVPILLLHPFYSWRNWGSRKRSHMPRVAQAWLQSPCFPTCAPIPGHWEEGVWSVDYGDVWCVGRGLSPGCMLWDHSWNAKVFRASSLQNWIWQIPSPLLPSSLACDRTSPRREKGSQFRNLSYWVLLALLEEVWLLKACIKGQY